MNRSLRPQLLWSSFLVMLVLGTFVLACSDDPVAPETRTIESFVGTLTATEFANLSTGATPMPSGGAILMIPRRIDAVGAPVESIPLLMWPADPKPIPTKTYEIKRALEFDAEGNAMCPNNGENCGLTIEVPDPPGGIPQAPGQEEGTIVEFFTTLTESEVAEILAGSMPIPPGGKVLMLPVRTDASTIPPDPLAMLFWPDPGSTLDKTYEIKRLMEFDPQGKVICPNSGDTCLMTIVVGGGDGGG